MKRSISGGRQREDDGPGLSQFLEDVFASVAIASSFGILVYALRSVPPILLSAYWYAGNAQLVYVAPLTVIFSGAGK
jgi:predicted branched-subunit amino acid permease